MRAAARTLDPVPGVDLDRYGEELRTRFANPAIAHETYQIAMDGTQKLPQRLIEPAIAALERGEALDAYAFAVAAWMRYCLGVRDDGESYALRDPREAEIRALLDGAPREAGAISERLHGLPGLFPPKLAAAQAWREGVFTRLTAMLEGMGRAITREAATCPA